MRTFGKVMRSKSMKMVFVARIIRHKLCMIYAFFDFFVQKSSLTKNYFHTAKINTVRGPLYTCLVNFVICQCNAQEFRKHRRFVKLELLEFLELLWLFYYWSNLGTNTLLSP